MYLWLQVFFAYFQRAVATLPVCLLESALCSILVTFFFIHFDFSITFDVTPSDILLLGFPLNKQLRDTPQTCAVAPYSVTFLLLSRFIRNEVDVVVYTGVFVIVVNFSVF